LSFDIRVNGKNVIAQIRAPFSSVCWIDFYWAASGRESTKMLAARWEPLSHHGALLFQRSFLTPKVEN
jgi:hypothetical protein